MWSRRRTEGFAGGTLPNRKRAPGGVAHLLTTTGRSETVFWGVENGPSVGVDPGTDVFSLKTGYSSSQP